MIQHQRMAESGDRNIVVVKIQRQWDGTVRITDYAKRLHSILGKWEGDEVRDFLGMRMYVYVWASLLDGGVSLSEHEANQEQFRAYAVGRTE